MSNKIRAISIDPISHLIVEFFHSMMLRINVRDWLKVHPNQSTKVLKNLVLIENLHEHSTCISTRKRKEIIAEKLFLFSHTFFNVSFTVPLRISHRVLTSLILARISPLVSAVG